MLRSIVEHLDLILSSYKWYRRLSGGVWYLWFVEGGVLSIGDVGYKQWTRLSDAGIKPDYITNNKFRLIKYENYIEYLFIGNKPSMFRNWLKFSWKYDTYDLSALVLHNVLIRHNPTLSAQQIADNLTETETNVPEKQKRITEISIYINGTPNIKRKT